METRNTIQRRLVLEAVQKLACHATADDVHREVALWHPDVSRATVYRNLNFLADRGDILKLEMPDGAARFDHNTGKHFHFVCQTCGRVYDLRLPDVSEVLIAPKGAEGFEITSRELVLKGICPDCQNETNKENRK